MAAKSHDLLSENVKFLRITTGMIPESLVEIEAFPADLPMAAFSVAILNILMRSPG